MANRKKMITTDILIIGAGASGLMAGYTLAAAGKNVIVLEARDRIGGRIHSANNTDGFAHAEYGAEFVHGNLPLTLSLLKQAGIATRAVDFEMWHYEKGMFRQNSEFIEGWDAFLKKLNSLEEDMPMQEFLTEYFGDMKYSAMREQVANYVAGYDTADIADASAFALRNEWNNEDESAQHRVTGGYSKLMDYLAEKCISSGGQIHLNTIIKSIDHKPGDVVAKSADGREFCAKKLIIALPLGILQASRGNAAVTFSPPIEDYHQAFNQIGFGAVIKILLQFDIPFWKEQNPDLSTMGFLFTGEKIPTFWTQAPDNSPLFTGWLGGPPAMEMKDATEEEILDETLLSLSHVFKTDISVLKNRLTGWKVANWTADPYALGSYSYDKVGSKKAKTLLSQPVDDTIYFAGEYLYEGPAVGTVEAALTSGRNAALLITDVNNPDTRAILPNL